MRKYLSTLHQRSEEHKKRFAFAVSVSITSLIFAVWSLATFGEGGVLAQDQNIERAHPEVSPLESLKANAVSSLDSMRENLDALKTPIESINLNSATINYGE